MWNKALVTRRSVCYLRNGEHSQIWPQHVPSFLQRCVMNLSALFSLDLWLAFSSFKDDRIKIYLSVLLVQQSSFKISKLINFKTILFYFKKDELNENEAYTPRTNENRGRTKTAEHQRRLTKSKTASRPKSGNCFCLVSYFLIIWTAIFCIAIFNKLDIGVIRAPEKNTLSSVFENHPFLLLPGPAALSQPEPIQAPLVVNNLEDFNFSCSQYEASS